MSANGVDIVLAYYGKKLSYNEIIRLAKLDPYIGCWSAQMADVALDLEFKTELINYNLSNIYDSDIANLEGDNLIKRLRKQKRKIKKLYYPEIEYDIEMIKKGGRFTLKISTRDDLIGWLKKGIPPILSVKVGPAYGGVPSKARKSLDQHAIIVYGYYGKNFSIHDPHPGKNAIKKLSDDLLMFSWYEGKAYTLLIDK